MPYFGLTSTFLSSPLLVKVCALLRSRCATCSGQGVRLTPVYLCAMLRFLHRLVIIGITVVKIVMTMIKTTKQEERKNVQLE